MRLAPRTEVRVIPDLLHGRDEHLKRDTEFLAVRACAPGEKEGPRDVGLWSRFDFPGCGSRSAARGLGRQSRRQGRLGDKGELLRGTSGRAWLLPEETRINVVADC